MGGECIGAVGMGKIEDTGEELAGGIVVVGLGKAGGDVEELAGMYSGGGIG